MTTFGRLRFLLNSAARIVDAKALYAQLVVTRDCNLSCAYCNEYRTGAPPLPVATLLARIDRLDDLGVLVYDLLGGEPLLHPELPALVRHIKGKRGGANLAVLISNGFLLNETRICELNEAGLDMLQISVDSVKPDGKSIKSLKSLMPKLRLLARDAHFPVKVQTVLSDETAAQYPEFRRLLDEFPFDFSFSLLHQAGGRIAVGGRHLIALLHQHRLWGGMRLYREDAEALLSGDFSRPWRCLGGYKFLYINAEGFIQRCSQQPGLQVPLMQAGSADLKKDSGHKPCESGCAIGCARLVSHSLAHPLQSFRAGLDAVPDTAATAGR